MKEKGRKKKEKRKEKGKGSICFKTRRRIKRGVLGLKFYIGYSAAFESAFMHNIGLRLKPMDNA